MSRPPCGAVGSFWHEALIRFHRSKAVIATQNYIINIKSRLRLDLTLPGAFFAERNSFIAWLNFFRRVTARARCLYICGDYIDPAHPPYVRIKELGRSLLFIEVVLLFFLLLLP